jgi:hypothetical protein
VIVISTGNWREPLSLVIWVPSAPIVRSIVHVYLVVVPENIARHMVIRHNGLSTAPQMAWSTVSRAHSMRTEAKGDRSNEMSDEPILSRCDSHDLRLRPQLA